jgi:hypothetical protein
MDVIFENKTTLSELDQYIKIQQKIIKSGTYIDKIIIINLILLVICFITVFTYGIAFAVFRVIIFALADAAIFLKMKRTIKKAADAQKNLFLNVEKTTLFYENYIKNESEKSSISVNYDEINRVISTDEFYIFIANGRFFPIDKNGFTAGDKSNFEKFIVGKISTKKFKQG